MPNLKKVKGERGLYINPSSGSYFVRIQTDGQDNFVSLETKKKTIATEREDQRRAAKAASKLGITLNPDKEAQTAGVTVAAVIKAYQEAGFPDKKGNRRLEGVHKSAEEANCDTLLDYFNKGQLVDDLRQKVLDDYHAWRCANITKGTGHRTTDLELNTLSNALHWAVRQEKIKSNPLRDRQRYHSATSARHCNSMAPSSIDELHEIAALLFQDRRSETLAWQGLLEGMTGLRTNEALSLRMDARPDEPGGLTEDGKSLCVRRSKRVGRDNPYVEVHAGLKEMLAAHKKWHKRRYPKSPWYFPGRESDGGLPVSKGALTKALDHLFAKGDLKKKFISQGLRAFYVLVRRSHGVGDSQIAWEINHIGEVGTLEKVYGGVPPHWLRGKGPKLSWTPKGKPAWKTLKTVKKMPARSEN